MFKLALACVANPLLDGLSTWSYVNVELTLVGLVLITRNHHRAHVGYAGDLSETAGYYVQHTSASSRRWRATETELSGKVPRRCPAADNVDSMVKFPSSPRRRQRYGTKFGVTYSF